MLVLVIMRDILVSKLDDSFSFFAIGGNRTWGIIPLKKQNYAKGYGEVLRIHNLSLC